MSPSVLNLHFGNQNCDVSDFPSMKSKKFLVILCREPLNYYIVSQRGSHKKLKSKNYPTIQYCFHNSREISGIEIKKILITVIGLTLEQELELIR
jgi:predicted RNA binding protein YcfA (HicA-like mRNA interferase family)